MSHRQWAPNSVSSPWETGAVAPPPKGKKAKEYGPTDKEIEEQLKPTYKHQKHHPWHTGRINEGGEHMPVVALKQCAWCHKGSESGDDVAGFAKCKGCRRVWYCGKDCQVKDWNHGHYTSCQQVQELRNAHHHKVKPILPPHLRGVEETVDKTADKVPQRKIKTKYSLDIPHLPKLDSTPARKKAPVDEKEEKKSVPQEDEKVKVDDRKDVASKEATEKEAAEEEAAKEAAAKEEKEKKKSKKAKKKKAEAEAAAKKKEEEEKAAAEAAKKEEEEKAAAEAAKKEEEDKAAAEAAKKEEEEKAAAAANQKAEPATGAAAASVEADSEPKKLKKSKSKGSQKLKKSKSKKKVSKE